MTAETNFPMTYPTALLPLDEAASRWADGLLGRLSLDQKIGQLMVFPHYGPFVTPDVRHSIVDLHAGGLRIAQKFFPGSTEARGARRPDDPHLRPDVDTLDRNESLERIACTAAEFAATLNELRDLALERSGGVPLHLTFDQEGEGADFLFEQRLFPYPMGIAASGDPRLAYEAALHIGRQARALGANMIHSPVLDVNTEPANPEIGPRAYGDDPETVARFATEALRGFTDAGIVSTGKHFPGRGHSSSDAHFGLPEIVLSREALLRDHVAPFKRLIDAGLPAIMAAFTAYPALGAADVPAATSRAIVTDLLRGELGFGGVVTTDNVQMGGLLAKYDMGEAVVRCLLAGCDLVLCRAYTPQRRQVVSAVREALRSGRYSERDLDASVRRVLLMRWSMDLAREGGKVDSASAGRFFNDPVVTSAASDAAARSTVLLRDRAKLVPLPKGRRILLVEQAHHFHRFVNNTYAHPGLLWRELRSFRDDVGCVLIQEKYTAADEATALARAAEADVIVATSYYNYRSHAIMLPLLEKLRSLGKPMVLVSNTPYERFGVPAWADTALVSFCPSGRENIRVAAEILAGARPAPATTLPIQRL